MWFIANRRSTYDGYGMIIASIITYIVILKQTWNYDVVSSIQTEPHSWHGIIKKKLNNTRRTRVVV